MCGAAVAALAMICALAMIWIGSATASGSSDTWSFVSAPDLHPPRLDVVKRRAGLARGDFLVVSSVNQRVGMHSTGQSGPMILDSKAQPVWFEKTNAALDFDQDAYRGKPVLVEVRNDAVVVLNEHYRTIFAVRGRKPWMIDGHDASIIGMDIWVVVVRTVQHQNLTAYGGPADGTVVDCGLQEYQLSTGRLIRTWDALNPGGKPNVPLSASEMSGKGMTLPGPHRGQRVFDPYHLNAVQALPDGDLLVSMRDTWAVYLLDPTSDKILWALGGRRSTFTLGHGARFKWQHDAKLIQPATGGMGRDIELTLFNDNNGHSSAGLVLRLNTITHKARLVDAYHHHPALYAQILGSMQLLPNGNALVGWGSEPYFSEYAKSGKLLFDAEWPGIADQSYRTLFTDSWVGTPYSPPGGAVRGKTVYASWNGATEVARWEVMAGSSGGNLTVVASHARTGFETAIGVSAAYAVYRVRALRASGRVLGTSQPFS